MGATLLAKEWLINGGVAAHSSTFTLPSSKSARFSFVIGMRRTEGAKPSLSLKLQKQVSGQWRDEQELLPAGTALAETISYVTALRRPAGTLRFEATLSGPDARATADIFSVDEKSENPFGISTHPINELGADVARQIPSLRKSLERSLITGLNLTGQETAQKSAAATAAFCSIFHADVIDGPCPANDTKVCNLIHFDYVAAPTTPGGATLTVPDTTFQYFLSNRIGYAGVAPATLTRIATQAGTTKDKLCAGIDQLSDISEVMLNTFNTLRPSVRRGRSRSR
jgi:hypothetical protein